MIAKEINKFLRFHVNNWNAWAQLHFKGQLLETQLWQLQKEIKYSSLPSQPQMSWTGGANGAGIKVNEQAMVPTSFMPALKLYVAVNNKCRQRPKRTWNGCLLFKQTHTCKKEIITSRQRRWHADSSYPKLDRQCEVSNQIQTHTDTWKNICSM